jgi:hypothetical protein
MGKSHNELRVLIFLLLLFGACEFVIAREPARILHAKVESAKTYMSYTRENKSEYWIDKDKMYRGRRNSIFISRQDMKVRWVIDTAKMTYSEYPIFKEREEKIKEDIHTFGQDYEPRFDWTQTELPKKMINGFDCVGIEIKGIDDFADTRITLWICLVNNIEKPGMINDLLLNSLSTLSEKEKVIRVLKDYKNPLLVKMEEQIENPIAPEIKQSIFLTTAENAIPPAGIFELPKNLKKLETK